MPNYSIEILSRDYTNYIITCGNTVQNLQINPYKNALLNKDIFSYDEKTQSIKIYRDKNDLRKKELCGILILENNKTYGKNKDKYLYKCVPNDKTLPTFYVPYKIIMEFSKMFENKYVTFTFNKWEQDEKPIGSLTNVIGGMNLQSYINYNFLCNDLHKSGQSKINKEINEKIKNLEQENYNNINEKYKISDRRVLNSNSQNKTIFTIDNDDTTDYDDAISAIQDGNNVLISVHIANVGLVLDLLNLLSNIDIITNVSTVYIPLKHYSMLPSSLEKFCSLEEGKERYVITMNIIIDTTINKILNVTFTNSLIIVYKNYRYEEQELLSDPNYILINNTIKKLFNQNYMDSHKLIEKLMIMINNQSAKILNNSSSNGIFRNIYFKNESALPIENNIINLWNNASSKYEKTCIGHQLVGLENNNINNDDKCFEYLHISSPIRRLVDILNMIELQKFLNLNDNNNLINVFHNKWYNNIDFINSQMKTIKKLQNNTLILWIFDNSKNKDKIFEGIILEINDRKITVYICELKMITTVKDYFPDVKLLDTKMFKIFVFTKEHTFKNKIRLKMVQ